MFRTVPLPSSAVFHCTHQWCMSYSLRAASGRNWVPSSSCSQAVSKPVWHIPLLCVQWKTPDYGQRNCPKHVGFYSKNKFEKLVHLVGFIIRIYHEARSPERQIYSLTQHLGFLRCRKLAEKLTEVRTAMFPVTTLEVRTFVWSNDVLRKSSQVFVSPLSYSISFLFPFQSTESPSSEGQVAWSQVPQLLWHQKCHQHGHKSVAGFSLFSLLNHLH